MFKIGDFSRLSQVSIKALRYYDEIGLLQPARIDEFTNYRYYSAEQLPRLNRILALKDLGLSLEQISDLLHAGVTPEQMGDLLRQKHAEIERQVKEEQQRLARVAARLRQIEQEGTLPDYEVVTKPVPAMWIAGVRAVVPTYAEADQLFDALIQFLQAKNVHPANAFPIFSLYHDDGYRERDVDMTIAAVLSRQTDGTDAVQVYELPAVETMLTAIHHGPYEHLMDGYTALTNFMETHHYCVTGPNRLIFLQGPFQQTDPASYVTEIQFPVTLTDQIPGGAH